MMINKKFRSFLLASTAFCFAAFLSSCETERNFTTADVNGDGKVSRTEFNNYMMDTIFSANDRNGDSKVTKNEYKATNRTLNGSQFGDADHNNDSAVTAAELRRLYQKEVSFNKVFREIVTNRNGYLSLEEVRAYKSK